MVCSKCGTEVYLDHMVDGKYFYVCLNRRCSEYRKAFHPSSGEVIEAEIKANTTTKAE